MDETKRKRRTRATEYRGEYKFETPELEAEAARSVEAAEKELTEYSVNFRWHKEQIDLVKSAAEAMGVPYQTYIKMCMYRQAKIDLGIANDDHEIHKLIKELEDLKSRFESAQTSSPGANKP
ncbi:MAG: hypothetical protein K2X81_21160 [Candidatus Obscuribacterales bacterium]|nr:hypothetical protein [Candidatus Obscuribacterales bacterium]